MTAPRCVTYGSDTEGWSVPPEVTSGRVCLPWLGSAAVYTFEMPERATRLNFFVVGTGAGTGGWFDLTPDWGPPGVPWNVTGDCRLDEAIVVQR